MHKEKTGNTRNSFAITEDGTRVSIDNADRSIKYFCPICDGEMTPCNKKRENRKKAFYFSHKDRCTDTWKYEPMSEWHKSWQERFPEENREVVVEKDGVRHRADVLINNFVIEFQHSPISSEEFSERNEFYKGCNKTVFWVFDVENNTAFNDKNGMYKFKKTMETFSQPKCWPNAVFLDNALPEQPNVLIWAKTIDQKTITPWSYQLQGDRNVYTFWPYDSFFKEVGFDGYQNAVSFSDFLNYIALLEQNNARQQQILLSRQQYVPGIPYGGMGVYPKRAVSGSNTKRTGYNNKRNGNYSKRRGKR